MAEDRHTNADSVPDPGSGTAEDARDTQGGGAVPATVLLRRLGAGDASAGDQLFSLVERELHGLARRLMAPEPDHTLQPTALVHEAWIRMAAADQPSFEDRAHFVRVAAKAMRHTLIDHARSKRAAKRGGGATREPLDLVLAAFEERAVDLLSLDVALERLARLDPQLAHIVEQRFFAQATNAEIARALDVSERTVERGWRVARAFLRTELSDAELPALGLPGGAGEKT